MPSSSLKTLDPFTLINGCDVLPRRRRRRGHRLGHRHRANKADEEEKEITLEASPALNRFLVMHFRPTELLTLCLVCKKWNHWIKENRDLWYQLFVKGSFQDTGATESAAARFHVDIPSRQMTRSQLKVEPRHWMYRALEVWREYAPGESPPPFPSHGFITRPLNEPIDVWEDILHPGLSPGFTTEPTRRSASLIRIPAATSTQAPTLTKPPTDRSDWREWYKAPAFQRTLQRHKEARKATGAPGRGPLGPGSSKGVGRKQTTAVEALVMSHPSTWSEPGGEEDVPHEARHTERIPLCNEGDLDRLVAATVSVGHVHERQ